MTAKASGRYRGGIGPLALAVVMLGTVFASAGQAVATRTLTVAIPSDEKNLTPYTAWPDGSGYALVGLVYDTLLWHDHDNNLVPWLAEDYGVSADGLTVNATLRDGVRWSDGQPLTAADVKFTYDYVKEFAHPRFTPEVAGLVDSVTTEGNLKVTFHLTRPSAAFLAVPLADVPILPEHVWTKVREPYPSKKAEAQLPVGSGPFTVTKYEPGKSVQLEANPRYFMTAPAIGRLDLSVVGDPGAQASALQQSKVDALALNLAPQSVDSLRNAPGVTVVTGSDYATVALTINTTRAPLDQVAVRQALSMAIDLNEVVKAAAAGQATPASPGFIHPESPFAKPGLTHAFDRAKAAAALDKAGFTAKDADGIRKGRDGKRLEFEVLADTADPVQVGAAQSIKTQLAAVGVGVKVTELSADALAGREGASADFDLAMTVAGPQIQDDPDRLGDLFATGGAQNIGKWSNADFDAKLKKEAATIDRRERIAQLGDIQDKLASEVPAVALFHSNGAYAFRSQAYADWVYVRGKGIVDKLSFVKGVPVSAADQAAAAKAASGTKKKSSAPVGLIGAGAALVVVLLAVLALVRRRRRGAATASS